MTFLFHLSPSNLLHCLYHVLLYFKTPKQVFFNPINIWTLLPHTTLYYCFFNLLFSFNVNNNWIGHFVDRLKQNGVQLGKITKGSVYQSYDAFKTAGSRNCAGNVSLCHEAFSCLLSLAYASDLLRDYGLEEFCKQLDNFQNDRKSSRGKVFEKKVHQKQKKRASFSTYF